jgi:hypothetical protein
MDDFVIRTHDDKEELIGIIRMLKLDPNKPVTVKIKEPKRRLSQNALYWVWMTEIAKFWNYDNKTDIAPPSFQEAVFNNVGEITGSRWLPINKDTVHDYFACYFLPKQKIKMMINGNAVYKDTMPSTSGLDVRQFNEYLTKIKMIMQEVWGYICDTPRDSAFFEYYMKLDKD